MIPTTKIRQETMVFTYLKACLISVGFMHIGGKEPRGRPGCGGRSGTEAFFLEGSEASGPPRESRMNREAPTSATIRRHSRATALILTRASHSHSTRLLTQSHTAVFTLTHAYSHTGPCCGPGSVGLRQNFFALQRKWRNHYVTHRQEKQLHVFSKTVIQAFQDA